MSSFVAAAAMLAMCWGPAVMWFGARAALRTDRGPAGVVLWTLVPFVVLWSAIGTAAYVSVMIELVRSLR